MGGSAAPAHRFTKRRLPERVNVLAPIGRAVPRRGCMSFELHHRKHIDRELRKIARRQLRRTAATLQTSNRIRFRSAVHDSRKSLKKVRAVAAFLEAGGGKLSRKDRARLKSAARDLSRIRDSAAIVDALDRLRRRYPKQLSQHTYGILRRGLVDARDRAEARARREGLVRDVAKRLKRTTESARRWSSPSIDWPTLIELLTESYRRSRKAMKHAQATGQSAAVHRWRKAVKTLWYQLRLAKPLTVRVSTLVDDLKGLETALGDDHNLVILAATLRACRGLRTLAPHIRQIDRLAARMREPLRRRAFALGRRLHRRKSGEFGRWLRASKKKTSRHAAAA